MKKINFYSSFSYLVGIYPKNSYKTACNDTAVLINFIKVVNKTIFSMHTVWHILLKTCYERRDHITSVNNITPYGPMTYLVVLMILPCIVSPPWPGRASHATPRCVYPAAGLMEMNACSWSIHFDAMNCSGVRTLPMCQITVCIQLCDIWTQRYWEKVWDISDTLVSRQEDVAQNVSELIQATCSVVST